MYPTYPYSCFLIVPTAAESTAVQRRGSSGRVRVYDQGGFSDHGLTLTHSGVHRPEVDEVLDFYKANRGRLFTLKTDMGDHWLATFTARPQPIHIDGGVWDLVVNVMRYDPREGGL